MAGYFFGGECFAVQNDAIDAFFNAKYTPAYSSTTNFIFSDFVLVSGSNPHTYQLKFYTATYSAASPALTVKSVTPIWTNPVLPTCSPDYGLDVAQGSQIALAIGLLWATGALFRVLVNFLNSKYEGIQNE